MEQLTIELAGKPTPKGRPRFTKTGRTYTDAKTMAAENALLIAWVQQVGRRAPHTGPITLDVHFVFTPPASWPKWRRELALIGDWPHTIKPDLDNLTKIVDGLNGVAWVDDSQINTTHARKSYGSTELTRITLTLHPSRKENK